MWAILRAMLFTNNARVVSPSLQSLANAIVVIVVVYAAFGRTVAQIKMETVHLLV